MEIKYLETLKKIIEEGSFTKAAQKLNYTQSTITFQVKQLENELNIQLFEKIGRQMILTKEGESILPYVDIILSSVKQLVDLKQNPLEGSLEIDVAETILCYKLSPVLKEFHEHAPKAKLSIRSTNCYEIYDKLKNGQTDIGIFYANINQDMSILNTKNLGYYKMDCVVSPKVFEENPDLLNPTQPISIPFVINEPKCIFRQIFEKNCEHETIEIRHTVELGSIPSIINLVENDFGMTYLPSFTLENKLKNKQLIKIPTNEDNTDLNPVIAYHRNKASNPLMNLFIELAQKHIQ